MSGSWTHDFNERLDLTNRQTMPGAGRESRWGHRGPSTTLSDVEEVEVIVAHHERATLRVGDVFLKIDADQTRTDVEIKAMTMAPIPTPELLWRKPPVLALAAVPGSALGRLGEPSTASSATWAAAGAAVRVLHEHARQALADPRLSKDMDAAFGSGDDVVAEGLPGPDFARHMLAVDPPDHTRLRRLVSAAFSTRRVEQLRPRVEEIVDELLDGIAARSDRPVDLVSEFALPLPFTVICDLLGVPEQTRPALRAGLADLLVPTSDGVAYQQARRGSDVVVGVIGDLIESKRADRGDDLISALIDARDGQDRLDERELRSSIFQLIVAGYHTTTTLIGNSVVALLDHANQLADLRADPDLISNAVEELLRYDPPVPHATFRYATEPVMLGRVRIPAGAQVLVSLAAANHDPYRFTDPHALELHRDDGRHLAFGHGTHFCLGAKLARMESRIALAALLQRFPRLRLATDRDELHWDQGDGLVLRSLTELPVWVDSEAPKPTRPHTTAENNRS